MSEGLADLERDMETAAQAGRGPYELGFYGGTFTALPSPWPERFLAVADRFRQRGTVSRVRCSTRPDCVDVKTLHDLRERGLGMVELGVQSFDDAALSAAGRGYDGRAAATGCESVKAAGLDLGVQLLPGLPGDRPGVFQSDVRRVAALKPDIARLYPCLVIQGAKLADSWRRGQFTPWSLERTVAELSEALLVLWEANVRVVRIGLASEDGLDDHVLAGPRHPALGQMVRSRALQRCIAAKVHELGRPPARLDVPRRYQGEIFGHAGELIDAYARLGLEKSRIRFTAVDRFVAS